MDSIWELRTNRHGQIENLVNPRLMGLFPGQQIRKICFLLRNNHKNHEQNIQHKEKSKKEIIIWLDGDNGTPVGIIVKKIRKGDEKVSTG